MRKSVLKVTVVMCLAALGTARAQDDVGGDPVPPANTASAPSDADPANAVAAPDAELPPAVPGVESAPAATVIESVLAPANPAADAASAEQAPAAPPQTATNADTDPAVATDSADHPVPTLRETPPLLPPTPRSRLDRTRVAPTEFLIYQRALQQARARTERLEERRRLGVSPGRPRISTGSFATDLNTIPGYYPASAWQYGW